MFADPKVQAVYETYEARAAAEEERVRISTISPLEFRDELLLPVGLEVGRLLHSLVLARKPTRILELGTSYGYSTLFLADAAREVGGKVITMELADYKQAWAIERIAEAGLSGIVDFRLGDAVAMIEADEGPFDFVLVDIWKELYVPCFEAFYPKLSEEGVIAADNMIFPPIARDDVNRFRAAMKATGCIRSTLLPIGMGLELAVKWTPGNPSL